VELDEEPPRLRAFTLPELEAHTFPHRRAILTRDGDAILREGHLAEIYAMRGTGKTWLTQTLGLVAATGTAALGFRAEQPVRVLDIDGENDSEEKQQRYVNLRTILHCPPAPNLTVIGADWQDDYLPRLDTLAGQLAVEPFVDVADLIIIDNRSTLFDPEAEKDPAAWQPAQNWLLSLRRRGKAVILVHHSNRQGGARGHSKPEDVMNLLIKLTRPDGYSADQGARFVVEFDKARGAHGSAVAPFTASLEPDGWHVDSAGLVTHSVRDRLLEHVRLAEAAGERVASANAAIRGASVNRRAGLVAWAELRNDGVVIQHPDGGWHAT
jgi:putative DNA primase/helicase